VSCRVFEGGELSGSGKEAVESLLRNEKPPIVLCGSLISDYPPTGIPKGSSMTKAVFKLLFDQLEHLWETETDDKTVIDNICWGNDDFGSGMGFETLFESCGQIDAAKRMLFDYFGCRAPNDIHKFLIEQMAAGGISSIITPNYDDCLDKAARSIGFDSYHPVIYENEVSDDTTGQCFYIHGCITGRDYSELIVTMSDEKVMPHWKKELLSKLVRGRYIIIFGYSGLDFEICPVLQELAGDGICKGVIYNNRDPYEKSKYNIRSILEQGYSGKNNNLYLQGDIFDFLNMLFGSSLSLKICEDASLFSEKARNMFSDVKQNLFWVLRLLNSMGCVKPGEKVAKYISLDRSLTESEKKTLKILHAALLYKAGKYKDSAKLYAKARRIREPARARFERIQADVDILQDEFECYRAGHYLLRASLTFIIMNVKRLRMNNGVKPEDRAFTECVSIYRRMMLWKNIIMFLHINNDMSRNILAKLYDKGISLAVKCGNRVLLQNFALESMSLEPLLGADNVEKYAQLIDPDVRFSVKKNTSAGYAELGTYFEYAIYKRREIMNAEELDLLRIKKLEKEEHKHILEKLAFNCYRCGIIPEAYKDLLLLNKSSLAPGHGSKDKNAPVKCLDLFNSCQYSFYFKFRTKRFIDKLG